MELILVRHGKAESGYVNPRRPLTSEGERDIESLGRHLHENSVQVRQIWHSGIFRARQTAEILAKHLLFKKPLIQMDTLSPDADPELMAETLNTEKDSILIVSHLPFLEYLCNLMLTGSMEENQVQFTAGCAVKLTNTHGKWSETWTVRPDELH